MKKFRIPPIKNNVLDLSINAKKVNYKTTKNLIISNPSMKTEVSNINELRQLEKILNTLVNSGKEHFAEKYLEGFLEYKSVISLNDYLKTLQ